MTKRTQIRKLLAGSNGVISIMKFISDIDMLYELLNLHLVNAFDSERYFDHICYSVILLKVELTLDEAMPDKKHTNYTLEEVHEQLRQRDLDDGEIAKVNRQNLIDKGLTPLDTGRDIQIHTDEIVGAENVAAHIMQYIREEDRIIALHGLSGVGKGTTAHALKGELNGLVLSFGEVFRYLTFMEYVHASSDHRKNLNGVYHQLVDGNLHLHLDKEDLSQKLRYHLQDPFLSSQIPSVSCKTQDLVIRFFLLEIERIKELHQHKIILEGRDYTLDFLPCDLRIELCANPMIRAKRRLNQQLSL